MNIKSKSFLSQFDSNFQNQIVEFSKRLTNISKEYNVLIFLARKAACLADCFEDLGLSQYHCIITSDRVLDMNIDWLEGKKIAIIDDALISGTTIYKTQEKLNTIKTKKVDVFVLSVDNNWWSQELVKPIKPYLKLNSKQTSIICSNIVNAISVIPRPYTIDYPLFKNIRISEKDFHDISNSSDWISFESTSSRVEKHEIINLTITPSEKKSIQYFNEVGLPYCTNTLLKLRIYAKKLNNNYWCQVLPIVILQVLRKKDLESLVNHLFNLKNNIELNTCFKSEDDENTLKGKLRFLQYYLACRLGRLWHQDIISFIDKTILFQQDFRNLNFLFSPPISNEIEWISNQDSISFKNIDISLVEEKFEYIPKGGVEFDEQVAIQKLSKPFLDLYNDKEIEARK